METNPEQAYTGFLRELDSPLGTKPEVLASKFRDIERMHSMGQITDWQLQNAREAYARTPGSKMAEAAGWALDKAKEGLHVGAELARDYTRTAVTTYTLKDPVRAILIAAGTGALLMALAVVYWFARELGRLNAKFADDGGTILQVGKPPNVVED